MSPKYKEAYKKIIYKLTEELCELSVELLHLANKDKQNLKAIFSELEDVEKQIGKLREFIFANRESIEKDLT